MLSTVEVERKLRAARTDSPVVSVEPKLSCERSLTLVGKYKIGYNLNFQSDLVDPYVREAVEFLFGKVPRKFRRYSRSGGTLENVYESLSKYDHDYATAPKAVWFTEAVAMAYKAFKLPGKLPVKAVSDVEFIPGASAGWTWLGLKKSDVYEFAVSEATKMIKLIQKSRVNKAHVPPCVTFKRTQLYRFGQKAKVRAVWGYPFEVTLLESMFGEPLGEAFKAYRTPMFYGRHVLKEIPIAIDNAVGIGRCFVTDISGFDATVPAYLVRIAFDIMKQSLEIPNDLLPVWDFVMNFFIKTPIVLPNGERYIKSGGIASGSRFTQYVGSIVNFILITSTQLALHGKAWDTYVLGDDSLQIVPLDVEIDRSMWASFMGEHFNMTMSVTKSSLSREPHEVDFLGHSSYAGRVIRDVEKVIALALYPEYAVTDPGHSVLRVMMLYADSGMRNNILRRIFDYLKLRYPYVQGDIDRWLKYVAGYDQPIVRLLSEGELFNVA